MLSSHSAAEVLVQTRTIVLRLRELPMRREARELLQELARLVGVERYTTLDSARSARARADRVRQAAEGVPPFRCPWCGATWPGARSDGRPRQACGDPRCSGRAAGLASAAGRRANRTPGSGMGGALGPSGGSEAAGTARRGL